jgi:ankyrin repeat protein
MEIKNLRDLMDALEYGKTDEVLQALIALQSPLPFEGTDALMVALEYEALPLFDLLLDLGAPVDGLVVSSAGSMFDGEAAPMAYRAIFDTQDPGYLRSLHRHGLTRQPLQTPGGLTLVEMAAAFGSLPQLDFLLSANFHLSSRVGDPMALGRKLVRRVLEMTNNRMFSGVWSAGEIPKSISPVPLILQRLRRIDETPAFATLWTTWSLQGALDTVIRGNLFRSSGTESQSLAGLNRELVDFLLDRLPGLNDPFSPETQGYTLLMASVSRECSALFDACMDRNADLTCTDKDGDTVAHYWNHGLHVSPALRLAMLDRLIGAGVDFEAPGENGTALERMIQKRDSTDSDRFHIEEALVRIARQRLNQALPAGSEATPSRLRL